MSRFDNVQDALAYAHQQGSRVRLHFGDTETGRDWMEEFDTMGRIGRSTGSEPRYILLPRADSIGGVAVGDSIVGITMDKHPLYRHPKYNQPEVIINDYVDGEYPCEVLFDGKEQARFKDLHSAMRYVFFIRGDRNTKGGRV